MIGQKGLARGKAIEMVRYLFEHFPLNICSFP